MRVQEQSCGKGAEADMFIGIGVGEGGVLSITDRCTCQLH